MVRSQIQRNLRAIKGKLRTVRIEVKEQLLLSYAWSLLIYFGTSLVSSNLRNASTVDKIE